MTDQKPTTQAAPSQLALIEAQWSHLHDLIDLPERVAAAVTSRNRASLVRAAAAIAALTPWPELSRETAAIYNMSENRARVARILTFINDGDRVVDIGCGNGSLGGQILRHKHLAQYLGVDASPSAIASFRSMAERNAIPGSDFQLVESTIEAAGETAIREVDPTLVLILEMLEHINDPGKVLRQVADSIGAEADVLISVPVLGQIEHEWGHVSVFDRARLERMAAEAGMYIHWVEPVMRQWLLLMLSKSPEPRQRLQQGWTAPPEPVAEMATDDHQYHFRNLDVSSTKVMATTSRPLARNDLVLTTDIKRVRLTAPATESNSHAGVTFYRPGMGVLRVKLTVEHPEAIDGAVVEFRRDGTTLERWTLSHDEVVRLAATRTLVFRRGFDMGRPHTNFVAAEEPDRLDLIFRQRANQPLAVTIHAAGCLPMIANSTQPRASAFVGLQVS